MQNLEILGSNEMYRKQLTYKKNQIKQKKDLDLSVNCKKKKDWKDRCDGLCIRILDIVNNC